jgi:hypothetical protein
MGKEGTSSEEHRRKKGKLIINSHDLNEYLISLVPPFSIQTTNYEEMALQLITLCDVV